MPGATAADLALIQQTMKQVEGNYVEPVQPDVCALAEHLGKDGVGEIFDIEDALGVHGHGTSSLSGGGSGGRCGGADMLADFFLIWARSAHRHISPRFCHDSERR